MLRTMMPAVAAKVSITNLIADTLKRYQDYVAHPEVEIGESTRDELRAALDVINSIEDTHDWHWKHRDWQHYIYATRGMLLTMLGCEDGALRDYERAMSRFHELYSSMSGFGEETQYLYLWLEARLAAAYEKNLRWAEAQEYLEKLLKKAAYGKPERLTNAIREIPDAGESDGLSRPLRFDDPKSSHRELLVRLLAACLAQNKLSCYKRAAECYQELLAKGETLTDQQVQEKARVEQIIAMAAQ